MRRKLSLLGGTTTAGDARTALGLIARRGASPEALVAYESAFAEATATRHATAFATGRVGLFALLGALRVGERDEVLVPAPTHIVVANAVRYRGATPVFVDCRPADWNLDLDSAAQRVSPRTRVLLVQHTFGIPVDMDRVAQFAADHRLAVIEDCVHALGASWDGRPVGGFGRAAFFSTEETKVISTTMGGVVTTDDPELHDRVREFRRRCREPPRALTDRYLAKLVAYHLLTQPELHRFARAAYEALGNWQPLPTPTAEAELLGGPRPDYEQRLDPAQAVLGLRQLARLPANLAHRRRVTAHYREQLAPWGFRFAEADPRAAPAWVRFPVWVEDRAAAVAALDPHTVPGTWFSSVLEEAVAPSSGGYAEGSCPAAEDAARHLVNLPTHPRVRLDDAERIAGAMRHGCSPR